MAKYFALDYQGGAFVLYGTGHLLALAVIAAAALLTPRLKSWSPEAKRRLRYLAGAVLLVNEVGYHLWSAYWGIWNVQTMLPLHICSFTVWGSVYMLFTGDRNPYFYEFMYFMGIGGALQALLTPDANQYSFPHFRAFQTFISHGLLVLFPLYMTVVEGYRPTLKSFKRVFIVVNAYMIVVFFVNLALGSNYLFIGYKPNFPTLLDFLAPWPWYILQLEVIGFAVFGLLYAPFLLKDWRANRRVSA